MCDWMCECIWRVCVRESVMCVRYCSGYVIVCRFASRECFDTVVVYVDCVKVCVAMSVYVGDMCGNSYFRYVSNCVWCGCICWIYVFTYENVHFYGVGVIVYYMCMLAIASVLVWWLCGCGWHAHVCCGYVCELWLYIGIVCWLCVLVLPYLYVFCRCVCICLVTQNGSWCDACWCL